MARFLVDEDLPRSHAAAAAKSSGACIARLAEDEARRSEVMR
jgi:hypothetical protein